MSQPERTGVSFVTTRRQAPTPSTDPSKVELPNPFVVCIIGASRAIGAGIAIAFAKARASGIILAARSMPDLESVADECRMLSPSARVQSVECDIASSSSVGRLAQAVERDFGRVDVVIVNSAFAGPLGQTVCETDPALFRLNFEVNTFGAFHAAHHFIPLLLATQDGAKAILAIGSSAAWTVDGPVVSLGYNSSKLAQTRLMEMVAVQYAEEGLLSVTVHPGGVKGTGLAKVPKEFEKYLTDDVGLCGSVCVWLSKERGTRQYLSGRYVASVWDMDELEAKKEEILKRDLLKARLLTA